MVQASILMVATAVSLLPSGALASEASVVAGRAFSFIINELEGKVMGMGSNTYGQQGSDNTSDRLSPEDVIFPEDEEVVQAAAGGFHSLFLSRSGTVYAAGRNQFGQLGDGTTTDRARLAKIELPNSTQVTAVAAGYAHSLLLTEDQEVYAFGLNTNGQLGDGSLESKSAPVLVQFVSGNSPAECAGSTPLVRAIAAGYDFSYFVLASTAEGGWECDGRVLAAGQGLAGQLGNGQREQQSVPVLVDLESVESVQAGESHAIFLLKNASLAATGANFDGQLGATEEGLNFLTRPTLVLNSTVSVSSAYAGGDSSCFVDQEGILFGFGSNRQGQLGLGLQPTVQEPTAVVELQEGGSVQRAAIGDTHTLFLQESGSSSSRRVFAAGSNEHGELGDGTRTNQSRPVFVADILGATSTKTTTPLPSVSSTITVTEPAVTVTMTTTPPSGVISTATVTDTATRGGQAGQLNEGIISTVVGLTVVLVLAIMVGICLSPRSSSGDGSSQSQEMASINV